MPPCGFTGLGRVMPANVTMDLLPEILKRVRRLELRTRLPMGTQLTGDYHSSFKGQGMDFAEHRVYQHGDEVRSIDWNVTARLGEPHIRTFIEERELNVFLAVDISESAEFASTRLSKRELATEISALLGFAAIRNNDRVGLALFSNAVDLLLPARKGRQYLLRLLREMLYRSPGHGLTKPGMALDKLVHAVPRRALVFLISDLAGEDFEHQLRIAARKHDLIVLQLFDPVEADLPDAGLLALEDTETGQSVILNTKNQSLRSQWRQAHRLWRADIARKVTNAGADYLAINTALDYARPLHKLLTQRRQLRNAR